MVFPSRSCAWRGTINMAAHRMAIREKIGMGPIWHFQSEKGKPWGVFEERQVSAQPFNSTANIRLCDRIRDKGITQSMQEDKANSTGSEFFILFQR